MELVISFTVVVRRILLKCFKKLKTMPHLSTRNISTSVTETVSRSQKQFKNCKFTSFKFSTGVTPSATAIEAFNARTHILR